MEGLRDLYQEVILDHNKNPRNFHKLERANHVAEGRNPLCGDHYTIYLLVEQDKVKEIALEGSGCAISKASASMMSTELKGKTVAEARHIFQIFHKVVTGEADVMQYLEELGKLAAFAGVAEFPVRVKCATLAWHAMNSALEGGSKPVTTESQEDLI
jgi:nitrogen fixation NifU-like protein